MGTPVRLSSLMAKSFFTVKFEGGRVPLFLGQGGQEAFGRCCHFTAGPADCRLLCFRRFRECQIAAAQADTQAGQQRQA